jgi:small-conductance mechanosensitive channel
LELYTPHILLKLENRDLLQDLLLYFYIVIFVILLYNITNYLINRIYPSKETSVIYNRSRATRYVFSFIGLICVIPVFYNRIIYLPTILAFTGAGLVISLKDITLNFIGWFLIHNHNGFSLGDRIEIDGVKGDVVNIGIMKFTLLEVNKDEYSDQSTNRLVHIPNHFSIIKKILVSSEKMEFIWDEINILLTFDSDFELAESICSNILKEIIGINDHKKEIENKFRGLSENYWLKIGITTPIIYTNIQKDGILLSLRFLTRVLEKRDLRSKISKRILKDFKNNPSIELLYKKHSIIVDH